MQRFKNKKNKLKIKKQKQESEKNDFKIFGVEFISGLKDIVLKEIQALKGVNIQYESDKTIIFEYHFSLRKLLRLRSVIAVYAISFWDISRPKALLGDENQRKLKGFINKVRDFAGHNNFRISASGKNSSVMQRLQESLCKCLPYEEDGEMLIKILTDGEKWQIWARLSKKPLSARSWRIKNLEGGLNATIAYAAIVAASIRTEDRIFNPMSGSGTFLIERALIGPYNSMVGVDISSQAIKIAKTNIQASKKNIEVAQIDALKTGLPSASFDLILADLPWGDAVSDHEKNSQLYPDFLKEMYRLCSKLGRMVVVTHEIKLFENVVKESKWRCREIMQVYSGGHYPKIYLLDKAKIKS